jgi:hypothetical protein
MTDVTASGHPGSGADRALVSLTYITMGRLLLRSRTAEQVAELGRAPSPPLMEHWTLRLPSGCMIVEVHADEEARRADFARSDSMFRAPVHRFSSEQFSFVDEQKERAALDTFARAGKALAMTPTAAPLVAAPGPLQGRLVSFNKVPHLPGRVHEEVWSALDKHGFGSVVQLALRTPAGETLIDAYLDESTLIDDFVFVHDVLAEAGYALANEWYPFTDRQHERTLDRLAYGLGILPELPA